MSFRDRGREHSKSELRPPDAKRSKGDRPISPAVAQNSNIPVFERRKMFEQTDSGFTFIDKPSIGKRSNRHTVKKGEIGRSGSFRGSKKIKTDVEGSPQLRPKQISSTSLSISQRMRYFGHYDIQSAAIERLASEKALASDHAVKKATGASAAHGAEEEEWEDDVRNDLVASCPAFKNEVGGDSDWLPADSAVLRLRNCLSHDKQKRTGSRERFVLDGDIPLKQVIGSRGPMSRQASEVFQRQSGIHFPLEFIDYGATYYRNYFLGQEHQNFFGIDEGLGPVAISLKREKVSDGLPEFYGTPATVGPTGMPKNQYRIILRTSKLVTLRGIVLEDAIPSGTKAGTVRGLPPRDVIEYVGQGELQLSCLKLGKQEKKVYQELVRLDEQELNNKYKIGVLYCKRGQTTEEEMYNNEQGSEAFEQFLLLLGNKVKMRGFTKYRAQLDNKTDTTGEYSVYTEFRDAEIMFHVSTLLPYTSSNKQQLLRKRHIGNDIVTVIFQEPGCEPFSPRSIRSHFQHIFVVVRVDKFDPQHHKYRVAVARSQDIPYFGPVIPEGAVFDKDDQFKEFLLAKLINACNASLRSEKFSGMAIRTRKQYLTDLAENCTTGLNIDQANNSGIVAGFLARNWGGRKRERIRQQGPLIYTPGALTWNVSIVLRDNKPLPFSEDHDFQIDCLLALGPDLLVFLDNDTKESLLYIPTHDICGWLQDRSRLNIFYDDCYCVSLETQESEEDLREIASRLQATAPKLTPSHEATLMEFHRGRNGLLGFGINEVGVVQKVDGLAKAVGLQTNSRLLQVEDRMLCCHTHPQVMELLTAKHRQFVKAYVVPPPPNTYRRLLHYPAVNWNAVWAARPSHNGDSEEQSSVIINEPAEPMDTSEQRVQLRSYTRKVSNTSRYSYVEAMQSGDVQGSALHIYDDSEPLYDRLMNFNPPEKVPLRHARPPKSPHAHHKHEDNLGYTRVRRAPKATRESVVQFADDLMERNLGGPNWDPEPTDHTIDVYSTHVRTQLAMSTAVPGNKPHKAAPLSLSHKRAGSVDQNHVPMGMGSPKSDVPHTPGQVHEMAKRFSFPSPVSTPTKGTSKIPVATSHHSGVGTPMKATGTTAEMTKSFVPTKAVSSPFVIPRGDEQPSEEGVQMRSGQRSVKMRPASWDASLIFNVDKENVQQRSKDDSTSDTAFDPTQSFTRNSNIRTPIRRKLPSHELSPEPTTTHTTPPHSPEANPPASDVPSEEQLQQLQQPSQGSSRGSEKGNGQRISVRERTKRWEARGGGLPSYFATLPKSFRHKADSVSSPPPASSQSQIPRRSTGTREMAGRTRNSVSNIPQPVSRIPSPRSSVPQLPSSSSKASSKPVMSSGSKVASSSTTAKPTSTSGKSSPLLLQEETDGCSNPDDTLQKGVYSPADEGSKAISNGELPPFGQSGDDSKDLESKKSRVVIESPSGRQPVIKSKSITITVGKSRGQSLLPTKTLHPASTTRAASCERDLPNGEKESSGAVHKGSQPSDRDSNIPRLRAHSSTPGHTGVARRSSAPCPPNLQNPSRTIPVPGRDKGSDGHSDHSSPAKSLNPLVPQGSNISGQKSSELAATGTSSLENGTDAMDLHAGVQNLSLSDGGQEMRTVEGPSGGRKPRTAHIEEWIRQTNASAVSPEVLQSEALTRDIGSPTFTDASLSYSQMSDHSQEVLESLKQRVEFLESRLEMETESKNELKSQLRDMEKQLHDKQNKRNRGIKTAII